MYGIEFHYFHDGSRHPVCQGSLDAKKFEKVIKYLDSNYELLGAKEFLKELPDNNRDEKKVCLTFDDGVRSQYDVAVPVMEKYGLTGFFFSYSSHFCGAPSLLEICHDFRFREYEHVDEFYAHFFDTLKVSGIATGEMLERIRKFKYDDYLPGCPWHSFNDKLFRYTRDMLITKDEYRDVLERMMDQKGYDRETDHRELWMGKSQLKELSEMGHVIGLHSHSHPTNITDLGFRDQRDEYVRNFDCLKEILGYGPIAAAYPCGKYNDDSFTILKELGIEAAFSASGMGEPGNALAIQRINHPDIIRQMSAV